MIEEFVQTLVMNQVQNLLPKLLPKAVSDLATPMIQESIKAHVVSEEAIEESIKAHVSIELNENRSTKSTKPNQVPRKRDRDDDEKDEGLSAGSNPGKEMKKQKSSKESDSSKKTSTPKDSSKGTSPSQTSKPGKTKTTQEAPEEPSFEMGTNTAEQPSSDPNVENPSPVADVDQPTPADDPTEVINKKKWFEESSSSEPQDPDWNSAKMINDEQEQQWFNQKLFLPMNLPLATTLTRKIRVTNIQFLQKDQLDWTNPEGYDRPVDMSKSLPLIDRNGRLSIPVEIFFNNDLEYLKGDKADRTYCSSIKKMPAARQQFYRTMINKPSKHKVHSKLRILSVISVTVDKWFGYGYLKEIVVKRADQKKYTFKEGDFPDLHLNDIKDMYNTPIF
ncbi:hypothetical protein Tco_1175225 [Tanacetum coccineum]